LFVGLDAAEPHVLQEGIASGSLPTLARLQAAGASGALGNCLLTLPGAVWPEIFSGVTCGTLPRFFHPRQIVTGEAAPRPLAAADVAGDPTFWKFASAQGRRVAVVDIPHAPPVPPSSGVQVVEYGLHDTHFGRASHPGPLLAELTDRHGVYPVASCDHRGGTRAKNASLLEDLAVGIERKSALILDLLGRERWDLFACTFSESHCVGHWFWHYRDASHWGWEPDAPSSLREGVDRIYAKLDAALGRFIDAAGADTVIVLASHGMAPYVAGYQLLPEVLTRLGFGPAPPGTRSRVRDLQHTVKHWIPRRYWEGLGRVVVEHPAVRQVLTPFQRRNGAMFFPLESPQTRAAYVPNNTIGAVRVNLQGREPFGHVRPGDEADRLMDDIRHELLALREPRSREPIVSDVLKATDVFGSRHHPDVPDLIVRFRQDLGLLERCVSPRVGSVFVPVGSRWGRRTCDHSPRSAAWVTGPAFGANGSIPASAALIDIAPTILHALGCDVPSVIEGRALQM
jgi:predicted AlkP superfamily phosphohydrolase/phosphomutase